MIKKYSVTRAALLVLIVVFTAGDVYWILAKKTQALETGSNSQAQSNVVVPEENLFAQKDQTTENVSSPESEQVADSAPVISTVAKQVAGPPAIKRNLRCPAKIDGPSISTKNKVNHMDEDCCPDYDEWPKPNCIYTAADYAIMLKGPTPGHITWAQVHAEHEAGTL